MADLTQRPLPNQCGTCPHMQVRNFKYMVRWKQEGNPESGDYVNEPHPCHEEPEKSCVGHCADLKLREDKVSPVPVPQDGPGYSQ